MPVMNEDNKQREKDKNEMQHLPHHPLTVGNQVLTYVEEGMYNQLQIIQQQQQIQGMGVDEFALKKAEELDADSFKTRVARTTLTHQMKEINVVEEFRPSKRKQKDDMNDTTSSSSKRTRMSE